MWDYPPKTAFVRCLYLSFYELFEKSGHGTLCQNMALSKWFLSGGHIYSKYRKQILGIWWVTTKQRATVFIEVLSQTKASKNLICNVKLFSVTLHTNFFFTNEPCVALSFFASDVVVFSSLKHLNTMLSKKIVWFSSIPTPISFVIWCLVYTGFWITRPAPFVRKVPQANEPSILYKCSLLLVCNVSCNVFKIHPFPLGLHGDQTIIASFLAVLLGVFPVKICFGIKVVLGADVFNVFWMHCKGRKNDNWHI